MMGKCGKIQQLMMVHHGQCPLVLVFTNRTVDQGMITYPIMLPPAWLWLINRLLPIICGVYVLSTGMANGYQPFWMIAKHLGNCCQCSYSDNESGRTTENIRLIWYVHDRKAPWINDAFLVIVTKYGCAQSVFTMAHEASLTMGW